MICKNEFYSQYNKQKLTTASKSCSTFFPRTVEFTEMWTQLSILNKKVYYTKCYKTIYLSGEMDPM